MVCSVNQLSCSQRTCAECATKFVVNHSHVAANVIQFWQWKRDTLPGDSDLVAMRCVQEWNSVVSVVQKFQTQLTSFLAHFYRVRHQYLQIRMARESLSAGEIM